MMIAMFVVVYVLVWVLGQLYVLIPVQARHGYKPVSTSHHEGTDTDSAVLIVLAKPIKLTPQHSGNKSKSKDNHRLIAYIHNISSFVVISFIVSQ